MTKPPDYELLAAAQRRWRTHDVEALLSRALAEHQERDASVARCAVRFAVGPATIEPSSSYVVRCTPYTKCGLIKLELNAMADPALVDALAYLQLDYVRVGPTTVAEGGTLQELTHAWLPQLTCTPGISLELGVTNASGHRITLRGSVVAFGMPT